MNNNYLELKEKHSKEFSDFPCFFAFNQNQFDEGMEKLGLKPADTDQVFSGIAGMIYKKSDNQKLKDMFKNQEKERKEIIKNDITGDGYVYQMFKYELSNHEYGYTYSLSQTLDSLDLTLEEIKKDEALLNGLNKALEEYK